MQTVKTMIRSRIKWHLIWVYTVCLCLFYGMLGLNGLKTLFSYFSQKQNESPPKKTVHIPDDCSLVTTIQTYVLPSSNIKKLSLIIRAYYTHTPTHTICVCKGCRVCVYWGYTVFMLSVHPNVCLLCFCYCFLSC